jgi:hypothetical protein
VLVECVELRVECVESVEKVDSVVVEHSDTLREVTTITVQLNDTGDTLKISTVTDRERIRSMSDVRSKKEDVYVRTDTVYIEKEAEKTVAVVGPNVEIDKDGNVTKRVNRVAQTLKWLFLTLVAVIAIIILIRIKLRR